MMETQNIAHCIIWQNLSFDQTVKNRLLCASGYVVGVFAFVGPVVPKRDLYGRVNGF